MAIAGQEGDEKESLRVAELLKGETGENISHSE